VRQDRLFSCWHAVVICLLVSQAVLASYNFGTDKIALGVMNTVCLAILLGTTLTRVAPAGKRP
jgi:hypothetical protein